MANRGVAELYASRNAQRAAEAAADAAAAPAEPPLVLPPPAAAPAAAGADALAAPAAAGADAPAAGGLPPDAQRRYNQIFRLEDSIDDIKDKVLNGLISEAEGGVAIRETKAALKHLIAKFARLHPAEYKEVLEGHGMHANSDSDSDNNAMAGSGKARRAHASDSYGDQWVQGMNRRVKASMLNTQA
jgi:hypothetical protein